MKPSKEELDKINSRLPDTKMKAGQVEVLPFRMFDGKITDRFTQMTPEMMNGVVRDLNNGKVAFNAMHGRSGGLPAGRSIEGKVVQGDGSLEVHAKMYAVTQRPDGTIMEDGKDLADRYNTGAVYACSAGVYCGLYRCSICGNDVRDYKKCEHMPSGTYTIEGSTVPQTCIAFMSGKHIISGPNGQETEDSGAYELSAVTAGGVHNAGIIAAFSHYDGHMAMADFKKEQFDGKDLGDQTHIEAIPLLTFQQTEEKVMADDKDILERYTKVAGENATLQLELGNVRNELATYKVAKTELEGTVTAHEKTIGEFTTKVTERDAAIAVLETEKATYVKEKETMDVELVKLNEFKTNYIEVVKAEGIKAGVVVDGYENLDRTQLDECYEAHKTAVAKLPAGQHSVGDNIDGGDAGAVAGIPDSAYKVR
jgi:hypothetical protein